MLIGSSPKWDAVRQSSPWQDYTDISTVGGQTEPKLLVVIYVKQGKPVFLLVLGRRTVRNADGNAGMGLQKKRMPLGNRVDRGSKICPNSKECRLLQGDSLQETYRTFERSKANER